MLNTLTKIKGNKSKGKIVGRGIGSGKGGHTSGRGQKGQKSRVGFNVPAGFEGGQVPLYKKLPHIGGFRNPRKKAIASVRLSQLNKCENGEIVDPLTLLRKGIINKVPKFGVKILASGELKKKLELKDFLFSEKAKELVEKSGSKILNA
jgi:large subunit ribosomal protein L15